MSFKLDKLDPVRGSDEFFQPRVLLSWSALLKFFLVLGVAVLVYKFFEQEVMALITLDVIEGIVRSGSIIMLARIALSHPRPHRRY